MPQKQRGRYDAQLRHDDRGEILLAHGHDEREEARTHKHGDAEHGPANGNRRFRHGHRRPADRALLASAHARGWGLHRSCARSALKLDHRPSLSAGIVTPAKWGGEIISGFPLHLEFAVV